MPPRRRMSNGQLRKRPTRPSGRAIIEAILEASRRIIESDGYPGLTSNRIAEAAGVSIGSFYQYFPDVEAVVAELARHLELNTYSLAVERAQQAEGDLLEMVDGLVDIVASELIGETRTRVVLLRMIPRGWIRDVSEEVDRKIVLLVRDALIAHAHRLPPIGDPMVSAFMLVTSVESVVEACLDRHPDWLKNGVLKAHLRLLVTRFLGLADPRAEFAKHAVR